MLHTHAGRPSQRDLSVGASCIAREVGEADGCESSDRHGRLHTGTMSAGSLLGKTGENYIDVVFSLSRILLLDQSAH